MTRNSIRTSGCKPYRRLSGLNRRSFFKVGTLGALGLWLADYFGLREAQGAQIQRRAKSIILIYTMGGISHHDSFDPKPDAPAEIRGEFKTIPTKIPGVRFSEEVPRLAGQIGQFALIRSIHHNERDHGVSAYYMLRGYSQPSPEADRPENQQNTNPNIGSHVARLFGSTNGLPPYIVVPGLSYLAQVNYYTAGWMGRAYDPFILKSDPNQADFKVRDLARLPEIPATRLVNRVSLMQALNRQPGFNDVAASKDLAGNYEKAFRILSSDAARRAFNLAAESDKVRDAYGRTRLGQSCLLARRLVEADVPFVTVDDDGWDHHSNVFPGLKQRLPELDRCLPALIQDLQDRGLLKTTLVALLTDFGRTPRINGSAGRDHWPGVFSVLLAGAGIPGGQVIGVSDRIGGAPKERPISPKDLAATIYHFLGIDPFQDYVSRQQRPFRILDEGDVIRELL